MRPLRFTFLRITFTSCLLSAAQNFTTPSFVNVAFPLRLTLAASNMIFLIFCLLFFKISNVFFLDGISVGGISLSQKFLEYRCIICRSVGSIASRSIASRCSWQRISGQQRIADAHRLEFRVPATLLFAALHAHPDFHDSARLLSKRREFAEHIECQRLRVALYRLHHDGTLGDGLSVTSLKSLHRSRTCYLC